MQTGFKIRFGNGEQTNTPTDKHTAIEWCNKLRNQGRSCWIIPAV